MKQRFQVRKELVQAIYAFILRPDSYEHSLMSTDDSYGRSCLEGIHETKEALDQSLVSYIKDDSVSELYPIDHAVLLLAAYELKYRPDVPYKVVIDQSIRLGKTFGGDDGFKLINAVVDQLAKEFRSEEISSQK